MKKHLHKANKFHVTAVLSILAIAMAGFLAIANTVVSNKNSTSSVTGVLGLTAKNNDYNVEISSVAVSPISQNQLTKRVAITTTITNTSKDVLQVSPGMQMFLVTDTGKSYPMTLKYNPAGTIIGGPLAPNSSSKLTLDYDIPVNETPKQFSFQPDSLKPTANIGL